MDPLEKVIRPIVEGQIRSFVNDHPEIIEAVNWYTPRLDKRVTLVNSISKRVIRDLLCPTTRARLTAALVGLHCKGSDSAELQFGRGSAESRSGMATAPALEGDVDAR